jgi:CspA family cold shock protein
MSSNNVVVTPSSELFIGRVKWFNNKAGYGFITVTDGSRSGSDIFVHHSAVNVENQQYKYLVQGEYVEFGLIKTTSGDHEWQASSVNGIKGGKLMCETRHDLKISRTSYKSEEQQTETKMPRQQRAPKDSSQPRTPRDSSQPRVRGEGPRDSEKKEWTLVSNKDTEKTKKVSTIRRSAPRQGTTGITSDST